MQVNENDEVILIADSGKMIRMPLENIRIIGRNTQGVRLMRMSEGDKVTSAAKIVQDETEEVVESNGDKDALALKKMKLKLMTGN